MTVTPGRLLLMGATTLVLGVFSIGVQRADHHSGAVAPAHPAPGTAAQAPFALQVLPVSSREHDTARSSVRQPRSRGGDALELTRRLRLHGTVLGAAPSAFIENTMLGTTRRYGVHEQVAGAVIEEIQRGSIRMKTREGAQVVLLLTSGALPKVAADASTETPEGALMRLEGRPSSGISLQVRPHLNPASGAFEGVAVEALEPPELARQVDIRPGDILCAVNGQRLLSPTQSLQVIKKAWQQSELSIELLRQRELLTKTWKRRAAL